DAIAQRDRKEEHPCDQQKELHHVVFPPRSSPRRIYPPIVSHRPLPPKAQSPCQSSRNPINPPVFAKPRRLPRNEHEMSDEKPGVGIIMGSRSDWPTLKAAADVLDALRVPYETRIVSAHRTPK